MPSLSSDEARTAMKSPIQGMVETFSDQGETKVEFVDVGKNPVCFQIGKLAYLRTETSEERLSAFHLRQYGVNTPSIAEGYAFYHKLLSICDSLTNTEHQTNPVSE